MQNIRRDLHCLPVITYKLCVLTWKSLPTAELSYLCELVAHMFHLDSYVFLIQISWLDRLTFQATFHHWHTVSTRNSVSV